MTNLPVPSPRTFAAGETETGAYLNAIRDALLFFVNVPIATVYQASTQALTGTAPTPVNFDSTAIDSYGGHNNTVNPSQYVAQVAGWYLVTGTIVFSQSTSGTYRKVQAYHNGVVIAYAASQAALVNNASNATAVPIAPTIIFMAVGDYVQLYANSDVSGLTVTPNANNESYMTVVWMHA